MIARGRRRDAILVAAMDLLLSQGYDRTSMEAVAARAGVSKVTLYAHFPEKLLLLRAVMAHAATTLRPNIADALTIDEDDPVERLVMALTVIVNAATTPEIMGFFRILIAEEEYRSELSSSIADAEARSSAPDVVAVLASFIEAVAADRGDALVDSNQWAIVLLRLAVPPIQFEMLTSEFHPDAALLDRHIRLVVGIFLNGALPAGQSEARLPEGCARLLWGGTAER